MPKPIHMLVIAGLLMPVATLARPAQHVRSRAAAAPAPVVVDAPAVTATAIVRDPAASAPEATVKGSGDDRSACFPPIGTRAPSNPAPEQPAQGAAQSAACFPPIGTSAPGTQTK